MPPARRTCLSPLPEGAHRDVRSHVRNPPPIPENLPHQTSFCGFLFRLILFSCMFIACINSKGLPYYYYYPPLTLLLVLCSFLGFVLSYLSCRLYRVGRRPLFGGANADACIHPASRSLIHGLVSATSVSSSKALVSLLPSNHSQRVILSKTVFEHLGLDMHR